MPANNNQPRTASICYYFASLLKKTSNRVAVTFTIGHSETPIAAKRVSDILVHGQVQKRFSSALDWISKLVLTVTECTADAARGLTAMRQIPN